MADKKQAKEIAALKAEVAALKAKVSPPKSEFKPEPCQQFDPTARMTMPPSVLAEMVRAVPDRMLRDIVHDNRAPTGRPGMIPSSQQPTGVRGTNVAGSGTGWARETPLGPPPGVNYADRLMDHQDAKDRAELIEREAKFKATQKMAEQIETMNKQTEALTKLAEQMK
jgi:hypothetical protein